jgi:hypothetical protein
MCLNHAKQQAGASPCGRSTNATGETLQADMECVSAAIGSILTMYDVVAVLDGIAAAVERICERGRLSVRHAQDAANMLTQLQLALNDLERVERLEHGGSAEMAEWFVVIQSGIKAIRDELYQRVAVPQALSRQGDDAHDPAGR